MLLGHAFGIPIRLDVSWVFIAFLLTMSIAAGFGMDYPYLQLPSRLLLGFSACLLLFASVLAHELSHAVIALRNDVGIRGITLFIFGGAAEMVEEPRDAGAEFRIAIAGPLMSLSLGILCWGGYRLVTGSIPAPLTDIIGLLARMNLVLVAFNLIPGFPLDGGRVLRAALWGIWGKFTIATRVASNVGSFFGALIMGFGLVWVLVFNNLIGGLWFFFIGLFLRNAARGSYRQVLVTQTLTGVRARDLMRAISITPELLGDMATENVAEETVAPDDDATKVLSILSRGRRAVAVMDHGSVIGVITHADLAKRVSESMA